MPTMYAVYTAQDALDASVARSIDYALSCLCPDRGTPVRLQRAEVPSTDPAVGLLGLRRHGNGWWLRPYVRLPRRFVRRTLAPTRSERYTLRIIGDGYPVAEYSYTGAAVLARVLDGVIRDAQRRGVKVAMVTTRPDGRVQSMTAYPLPNGRVDLE